MARCHDCGDLLVAGDDEAYVCIQCGGRNRRCSNNGNARLPRILALCLAALAIGYGTSEDQEEEAVVHIGEVGTFGVLCIEGVQYLSGFKKLAPRFGRDGKVLLCDDGNDGERPAGDH